MFSRVMLRLFCLLFAVCLPSYADDLALAVDRNTILSWTNSIPTSVFTIEQTARLPGPWTEIQNLYVTSGPAQLKLTSIRGTSFIRLFAVDIGPTLRGYSNLIESYGVLRTIAGNGDGGTDGVNYWQPRFEGGPATNASLSRPHFAMADATGNIFIADKDSHSILKVTPDGLIHTFAGTHQHGFNGDGPAPALSLQLDSPNGEWVRPNGTVYVLDTGNSKIRRVSPNGIMTTLFTDPDGISNGRGLWVREDEGAVYYASGTKVKRWTPATGIVTANNKSFVELGNLIMDTNSNTLLVTDRGANRAYRLYPNGTRDPIAGNGSTDAVVEGALALNVGLSGVRGIWPLPNGGYLLATHQGSQVLYVDAANVIHVFLDGAPGNIHAGDDAYFHAPGLKISEVRSVTMDPSGNLLVTENDYGYIRMISFHRIPPSK